MSFVRIVNNYGRLYKLGKKIIKHKQNITHIPRNKLNSAFEKQEVNIEKFEKLTKRSHNNWKKNKTSINEFWTGYQNIKQNKIFF